MLNEVIDLQSSDESLWGATKVSFTITTRSDDDDELVEREYTFSHAPEWEKWVFDEFEEKRTPDTNLISRRNWRRSRHVFYEEGDTADVDIPPEVEEKLQELLNVDNLTIQSP